MKHCIRCNISSTRDDEYCGECGSKMLELPSYCPECRQMRRVGTKGYADHFCPYCCYKYLTVEEVLEQEEG